MSDSRKTVSESGVSPLRKKNATTGEGYRRFPNVETVLIQLLVLPHEEILQKCEIDDENDANFVPSECLVHLVRSLRVEPASSYFERLYGVLMRRILRHLPASESPDGRKLYLNESLIQEGVIDAFQELLARDRTAYDEKLDFWEVAFGRALKLLKITVQKKVRRDAKRSEPLESPVTGEIAAHVASAVELVDPFNSGELLEKDYREQLPVAIECLPPDQRRMIKMCLEGFPIDSINPNAVTISNSLKLSEKTVRTKIKKALATLKKHLEKGDVR